MMVQVCAERAKLSAKVAALRWLGCCVNAPVVHQCEMRGAGWRLVLTRYTVGDGLR